ncbi:hypothetical protein SARC_06473 [Sphaeroforma arctica JP610]|uniref:Uncharacterized protein n=1 Tax=Sphaeroforma arctica JP610 TaxID=667725 RepID=A0A0L0FWI0_9EUKA|nr:hypothetical protein SARC_06473 [Sphaeroforma arctica JP610]KNC81190.1 hypothetical protein SARC_06473 [Sphaeroforma arctica JP610]|eukprot:XP_014155092.1 hypothetical protein SARC_06473 [Sphaeroforma arctica JP610]
MCNGDDPILTEKGIPLADKVDRSADELEESTNILKDDKLNADAMKLLAKGAQGILSGTTDLLEAFDESEVRDIVKLIDESLAALEPLRRVGTAAELVKEVKAVSLSLLKVARSMEKRRAQLQEGTHLESVKMEIEAVKSVSPLMVSACKTHLLHKDNENAVISRDGTLSQISSSLNKLRFLVQLKFFRKEDFFGHGSSGGHLEDMMLGKKQGDKVASDALLSTLDEFLRDCEAVAKKLEDGEEKSNILADIAGCRSLQKELTQAFKALSENPDDPACHRQVAETSQELYERVGELALTSKRALARRNNELVTNARLHATEAISAGKTGDPKETDANLAALEDDLNALEGVSNLISYLSTDDEKAHKVNEAMDDVKGYTPVLAATCRMAASIPEDKALNAHASMVKSEWDRKMDKLEDATDRAIENQGLTVGVLEEGMFKDIAAVKTAAEAHSMGQYTPACVVLQQRADKLNKLLAGEADRTGVLTEKDLFKTHGQALTYALNAFNASSQKVVEDGNDADSATKAKLAKDAAAMEKAVIVACNAVGCTDSLADIERKELQAKEGRRVQKELEIKRREEESKNEKLKLEREAEERKAREAAEAERIAELEQLEKEKMVKLLQEEEEKKQFELNTIGQAAEALHEEANQWDENDNDIICLAKKIAESFNKMAVLEGQQNCKRELITLAKTISTDAREMAKLATKFADNCADKRLKANLLNTVAVMETIGAQLKIIAAVKASSPGDQEADDQLNICAANLMGRCQECVSQCHSASIKPIDANHPLMEKVTWRKKVYRNRDCKF